MTIELGTEIMSLQAASGTGLGLRTESARRNGGMPARPLRWYKALIKNEMESLCRTSDDKSRRYFFDCDMQPGYLTGLFNVHQSRQYKPSSQPEQPSHLMAGFFDDICNPASAGFFNVPSSNLIKRKIPTSSRDFSCTYQS